MVTEVAFVGVMAVFVGLALSAYAIYVIEGRGHHGFRRMWPRRWSVESIMRWMMRDFAIFLYGCLFACKYTFLGRTSRWQD